MVPEDENKVRKLKKVQRDLARLNMPIDINSLKKELLEERKYGEDSSSTPTTKRRSSTPTRLDRKKELLRSQSNMNDVNKFKI